jgi:hypothetical protein
VLNDRLNNRVDDMMKVNRFLLLLSNQRGLVDELKVIRQLTMSLGHKENFTEGIFQAIGNSHKKLVCNSKVIRSLLHF